MPPEPRARKLDVHTPDERPEPGDSCYVSACLAHQVASIPDVTTGDQAARSGDIT